MESELDQKEETFVREIFSFNSLPYPKGANGIVFVADHLYFRAFRPNRRCSKLAQHTSYWKKDPIHAKRLLQL